MAYINYKTNNPIYSPGLSTYSPKGEKGDIGQSGSSIYYTNGVLSTQSTLDSVNAQIRNGRLISSDGNDDIECAYRMGDVVVDEIGDVYQIVEDQQNNVFEIPNNSSPIGNIMVSIKRPFSQPVSRNDATLQKDRNFVISAVQNIDTKYLVFGISSNGSQHMLTVEPDPLNSTVYGFMVYEKDNSQTPAVVNFDYKHIEVVSKATGEIVIFDTQPQ